MYVFSLTNEKKFISVVDGVSGMFFFFRTVRLQYFTGIFVYAGKKLPNENENSNYTRENMFIKSRVECRLSTVNVPC